MELVQIPGETDAIEHFQSRRVNRVASEVPVEVGMHLEHVHAHAAPGQQQPRTIPAGPNRPRSRSRWKGNSFERRLPSSARHC
jgi:hypothetical protein